VDSRPFDKLRAGSRLSIERSSIGFDSLRWLEPSGLRPEGSRPRLSHMGVSTAERDHNFNPLMRYPFRRSMV